MSALTKFARMLGIADHNAEEALRSERAAKAVLSRRSLFAAGAAMAAGTVLVPGAELVATLATPRSLVFAHYNGSWIRIWESGAITVGSAA